MKKLLYTGNLCKIVRSGDWKIMPFGYNRNKRKQDFIDPGTICLVILIYGIREEESTGWAQVLMEENIWDVHIDFLERIDG